MGPGLAGVKHAEHLGSGCVNRVSVLEGIESRLGFEYRHLVFFFLERYELLATVVQI